MSNRLDQEREKELEPKRMAYAKKALTDLGYGVTLETDTTLQFEFNGKPITLYVYSGWHTGKTIKDGRGIKKLLNQIKK